MPITKDKIKRSLLASGIVAGGSEYLSAAATPIFEKFVNYEFNAFWTSFEANLSDPLLSFQTAMSDQLFHQTQPFILGITLLVAGKVLFSNPKTYQEASNYGAYGSSRWAKDADIFDTSNITTKLEADGPLLGMYKNKPLVQHEKSSRNRNMFLVGGSGAGKTAGVIMGNILKNKEKSMVIIDPKGELYEKTSQMKREQGYDVHLVNFKDRDISDRYNLFEYIRRDSDAYKAADTLAQNTADGAKKDFFFQAQISVLQAFILYVKYALPKEEQHMGSVLRLSSLDEEQLKELFNEFPPEHVVHKAYSQAFVRLKEKTLGDVFATLNQTLNPWQYDDVCSFTSGNDFLFEDIGKKKKIVYVIIPIADNEFRPLITTFFQQMFSELYRVGDYNGGKLPQNVFFALDEFANIGKVPDFEQRLSTTRSYGIEVTIVLQNMSQLEKTYGKESAKEIIDNCDIRMLLKSNEFETSKYFSNLAGKTTIKIKNESNSSSNKSSSKSESTSFQGRDLITTDEVQRLGKDEMLLFLSGKYPMKVQKAWYFKFKQFKSLLGETVSREDYPVHDRGQYKEYTYISMGDIPTLDLPDEEPAENTNGRKTKEQFEKTPEEIDDEPRTGLDSKTDEIINDEQQKEMDPKEKTETEEKDNPDEDEKEPESLDEMMKNFNF